MIRDMIRTTGREPAKSTRVIENPFGPSPIDKPHSPCTAKHYHRIRLQQRPALRKKIPASVGRRRRCLRLVRNGRNERRAGVGHGFAAVIADLLQGITSAHDVAEGSPRQGVPSIEAGRPAVARGGEPILLSLNNLSHGGNGLCRVGTALTTGED